MRRPLGLYKRPWREAVFAVAESAVPAATVYTPANRQTLVAHYLKMAGRQDIAVVPVPEPLAVPQVDRCIATPSGCPFFTRRLTLRELVATAAHLVSGEPAWFVAMDHDSLLPQTDRPLGALLAESGVAESVKRWMRFADIEVYPPTF